MIKRLLFLTVTILALLISCDKENEDSPKKDKILFNELNNPITAHTVRDWDIEVHSTCSVDVPIPSDSSTTIYLDINKDAENDFKITLFHKYYIPEHYCGHCSVYVYEIKIQGIGESNLIASYDHFVPAYFSKSDTIAIDNMWINSAYLIEDYQCDFIYWIIEDEYIGFKHGNQIGWIKLKSIANNGIRIYSYAINLTDNREILAGQTK